MRHLGVRHHDTLEPAGHGCLLWALSRGGISIDESRCAIPPRWLGADEAAALLGVKKATLYTYASRGWIRTAAEGRSRRYLLDDLHEIKLRSDSARGHAAAAAGALRFGPPVLDTAISAIDPRGPRYRGQLAVALAEQDTPFESVATLLWTGTLPEKPPPFEAPSLGVALDPLLALIAPGAPVEDSLPLFVAALRRAERCRPAADEEEERARSRALLRQLTAAVALGAGEQAPSRIEAALAAPSLAAALGEALGASDPAPEVVRALDRALVLCADHELNASTFAARVAAGTGADRYAVLLSALATWSGPRHGGASEPIERLVLQADDPTQALRERARLGEELPGFGHRLYPQGDPRGRCLLQQAERLGSTDPRWLALKALVPTLVSLGQPPPNLDTGLVGLCFAMGLPVGSARAVFAVGRAAGWLAHAQEQRASGQMLRPRAHYVGRSPATPARRPRG